MERWREATAEGSEVAARAVVREGEATVAGWEVAAMAAAMVAVARAAARGRWGFELRGAGGPS